MLIKEIEEIFEIINKPNVDFNYLKNLYQKYNVKVKIIEIDETKKSKPPIGGGKTHFVKIKIITNKKSLTLQIIGQLGGVGARPNEIGFVSDGDGALVALSVGLKLAKMIYYKEEIKGNFIISTHICPNAPTLPKKPVSFMGSPVKLETMNKINVEKNIDALISVDTTRGNRIIKNNYFAITPIIKEGWILKIPDEIIDIMEWVSGENAAIVPITMQDITPYSNGVSHINSILQPSLMTDAPTLGVAITSKKVIPGSASNVTNLFQIDLVSRFIIELAIKFGAEKIEFYDKKEFNRLLLLYGSMKKLQNINF